MGGRPGLGMTEATTFRRIILPQALQTALGPMTNDFVALFKDTSLVSVIAVRELTKEYMILSRSSLKFLELGLLTASLYLCMSIPLGYLSRYLESALNPFVKVAGAASGSSDATDGRYAGHSSEAYATYLLLASS